MTTSNQLAQLGSPGVSTGFKNRIINGAMVVNQRNTAVTADLQYTVDRWRFGKSNDAVESVAQSTDAPTGFTYSLKNTVGTADTSIGASQYSNFKYAIEGYNVADLAFGTSSAKTITLSFWVKSSVAGLYAGNICNSAEDRICPFTYTVNSANTWEYKTYTFQGDTSGTWLTTNGIGLASYFYMALGSNYYNGTAGTWGTSPNYGAGGSSLVNVLATVGNTFAITGVQLEVGTNATSFEYRPYGTELALCQRYFERFNYPTGQVRPVTMGQFYSTTGVHAAFSYSTKRAAPTVTGSSATHFSCYISTSLVQSTTINYVNATLSTVNMNPNALVSAGTINAASLIVSNDTAAAYIDVNSEL